MVNGKKIKVEIINPKNFIIHTYIIKEHISIKNLFGFLVKSTFIEKSDKNAKNNCTAPAKPRDIAKNFIYTAVVKRADFGKDAVLR